MHQCKNSKTPPIKPTRDTKHHQARNNKQATSLCSVGTYFLETVEAAIRRGPRSSVEPEPGPAAAGARCQASPAKLVNHFRRVGASFRETRELETRPNTLKPKLLGASRMPNLVDQLTNIRRRWHEANLVMQFQLLLGLRLELDTSTAGQQGRP